MKGRRPAGVCRQPGRAKGKGCSVTRESHYEKWRRHARRMVVGVSGWLVLRLGNRRTSMTAGGMKRWRSMRLSVPCRPVSKVLQASKDKT